MNRRLFSTLALLSAFAPYAFSQAKPGDPVEEMVETSDGVKLRCRYYQAAKEANGSCAILLHDVCAKPDDGDWDGLARFLAVDCGIHVMRFDFRGHGKSTEIIPDRFWNDTWNQTKVNGFQKRPVKTTIDIKDFKSDYYAMLVNDIAAVRNALDLKNDDRKVNTRSVYLIASGSAAPLAYLFLATEWHRQQTKPEPTGLRTAVPDIVTSNGFRAPGTEVAGKDYAGVVFLSPSRTYNYEYGNTKGKSSIPQQKIKDFVSNYARDVKGGGDLRSTTGMLFIAGDKDDEGIRDAKFFHTDVMAADSKSSKLEPMKNTKLIPIKDAKEKGIGLLGKRNAYKTEDLIQSFITKIEDDRKRLNPIDRKYEKPFKIGLTSFGLN